MTTVQEHLRRFPNARPSTLAHLQKREETHAKLRAELDAVCDKTSKRMMEDPKETLIERLVRKMRSL